MKHSVSLYEAKTQLSTLLREVEGGAVVTITRHGKAVAELRPCAASQPKPKRGVLKSPKFYMSDDFDAPLEDFAEYMTTADEEGTLRVAEAAPAVRSRKGKSK